MAEGIKGKAEAAGQKIVETAKEVGHKVSEGAEWVKEKAEEVGHAAKEKLGGESCGTTCSTEIREHMDVIGSCGNKLGVVDHLEGSSIKLTKDSSSDGQHHFLPLEWVDHVDAHVHLNKNCGEAQREWGAAPVGAGV